MAEQKYSTRFTDTENRAIQRDVNLIAKFIQLYCKRKHKERTAYPIQCKGRSGDFLRSIPYTMCTDCRKLLIHMTGKRILCDRSPKPRCKKCVGKCHAEKYRSYIKKVMRSSGIYFILHGRLDLIFKYFF